MSTSSEALFEETNVLQYLHEISSYPMLDPCEEFCLSTCIRAEVYLDSIPAEDPEEITVTLLENFSREWETFGESLGAYNNARKSDFISPELDVLTDEIRQYAPQRLKSQKSVLFDFLNQNSLCNDTLWRAACTHLYNACLCIALLPEELRPDHPAEECFPASVTAHFEDVHSRSEKAKDLVVTAHLRLVYSIARHYVDRGADIDDLTQEGNLSLWHAVEKFDPILGYRFSGYATWWIRRDLTRSLAEQSMIVRVPTHTFEAIMKIKRIRREMEALNGTPPTDEELAKAAGVNGSRDRDAAQKVRELLQMVELPVSLGYSAEDSDDEYEFPKLSHEARLLLPEEEVDRRLLREKLNKAMSSLKGRECFILEHRYGLFGEEKMTLDQLGKELGISSERVRQIETLALRKLQNVSPIHDFKDFS